MCLRTPFNYSRQMERMNTTLGYAIGEIGYGNGLSGGVGAVVGEVSGEYFYNNKGYDRETSVKLAGLYGGIAGGIVGGDANSVSAGQIAGGNAARWNATIMQRKLDDKTLAILYNNDKNPIADKLNLEGEHQQIFYTDNTNSGFFADGTVRADYEQNLNLYDATDGYEYDDSIVKQAEINVRLRGEIGEYNFCTNNCQGYVNKVINEYWSIHENFYPHSTPTSNTLPL